MMELTVNTTDAVEGVSFATVANLNDEGNAVVAAWKAGKKIKQVEFPLTSDGELNPKAFIGGICAISVMKAAHIALHGELSTNKTRQPFIDSVFATERKLATLVLADDDKEHRLKYAPTKRNPERTIIQSRNKPLSAAQVKANAEAEAQLKDDEIAKLKAELEELKAAK